MNPLSRDLFHPARAHARWAAAALLLSLAACGGGGGADTPPAPVDGRATPLASARPGELGLWAQDRLRALDRAGRLAGSGGAVGSITPVTAPGATAVDGPSFSRTLVQEDGVDEADLLRTDGRHLQALVRDGESLALLAQTRDSGGTLGTPKRMALDAEGGHLDPEGLMARDDGSALVALARRYEHTPGGGVCAGCMTIAPVWTTQSVWLQRFDTRDAANPQPGTRVVIDGELVDSRRIGDTLVVVAVHRPVLAAQALPGSASASERNAAIAAVTSADLIPTLRRDGGSPEPLLADADCWLQTDNGSALVQLTTITMIDLASPTLAQRTRCFAGGTEAVLLTPRNLWLATTRSQPLAERLTLIGAPLETDVHQFAVDLAGTGDLAYRGSVAVDGHLGWDAARRSHRLGEHEGYLRVLSYTGGSGWAVIDDAETTAPSPAKLTVIRADSAGSSDDGRTLAVAATLPNERRSAAIGKPGEQVYAVRFAGTRGYVVTFRQVDPLYVLDLSDPADPRVAGEWELPGYSQTLVPIDGGLLFGLGREADAEGRLQGLQFTLFDVADPAAPRVLTSLVMGEAGSQHTLDMARHGLALRQDGSTLRLALPVLLTSADWSSGTRALQTFVIDTAARTLATHTRLAEVDRDAVAGSIFEERAVLIDDQAILLRDGSLSAFDW